MRSLLVIPALAIASLSFGLGVGDKAPALEVAKVVKGKSVDLSKGLHVVEFWATWCVPCKVSIPHLTELAAKYKGKCDFTGVSVWETGDNQLDQVKKFVTQMGPKMNYNVDFDGDAKAMTNNWMAAAKQNGIPAAFLVKDGEVMWIGHPMGGLDEAIGQVISGQFDLEASKAKFNQEMAQQEKQMAAQKAMAEMMKPYSVAMKAKDYAAALKALDDVEAAHPDMKPRLRMVRYNLLILSDSPDLVSATNQVVADNEKNPQLLNSVAWSLIDPAHNPTTPHSDIALILAKGAADATSMKDPMILDTYALALSKTGDKKKALEIQTTAVELMKAAKTPDADTLKDMESRLDQYKKDAA